MKKVINWFKTLIYIVNNYDKDMKTIHSNITYAENEIREGVKIIKDRTDINVEVDMRRGGGHAAEIITIGRYRKTDYIQAFSIDQKDFEELISRLRAMEKYGVVRKIDAAYDFKAVVMNDLEYWRE